MSYGRTFLQQLTEYIYSVFTGRGCRANRVALNGLYVYTSRRELVDKSKNVGQLTTTTTNDKFNRFQNDGRFKSIVVRHIRIR